MISRELVAASSIPLVLSILSRGESYGCAIMKSVRSLSENELEWTDGMLYPVLHRLEEQGWIESVWRTAQTGRRREGFRSLLVWQTRFLPVFAVWAGIAAFLFPVIFDTGYSF